MLKLLAALFATVFFVNGFSTEALAFDDPVLNQLAEIANSTPPLKQESSINVQPDLPSNTSVQASSPGSRLVGGMYNAIGTPVRGIKNGGYKLWKGTKRFFGNRSPVSQNPTPSPSYSGSSPSASGSGATQPYSQPNSLSSSPAYQPASSFGSTPSPIGYSRPAYSPISFGDGYGWTNPSVVPVSGYFRKNGTYVAPYMRTARNNTMRDNFSTRGNTNPFTGRRGTRRASY